jgi:propionyl-CoA carboxylase alpha chain/3-methylcrotonyl-CoA carboxylase alpha subunit/acetyl-CoA/propionyl-CoA carboxylase biotin carboxyl carrier protein
MNTRLQVEHPVTEAVTGLDLVAEQIRVAAGAPLSFGQADVTSAGHAIELRIYAEDPARGFAPETGRVMACRVPRHHRTDSGIAVGSEITSAFDPLLAKLVVHGADRPSALRQAHDALGEMMVLGCGTNIAFLKRLTVDADVMAGRLHTGLVDEKPELLEDPPLDSAVQARLLGIAAQLIRPVRDAADAVPALHAAIGAWRN